MQQTNIERNTGYMSIDNRCMRPINVSDYTEIINSASNVRQLRTMYNAFCEKKQRQQKTMSEDVLPQQVLDDVDNLFEQQFKKLRIEKAKRDYASASITDDALSVLYAKAVAEASDNGCGFYCNETVGACFDKLIKATVEFADAAGGSIKIADI